MRILYLAAAFFLAATASADFQGPTEIEGPPDGPTDLDSIKPKKVVHANTFPRSSLPDELRGNGVVQITSKSNRLWSEYEEPKDGVMQAGDKGVRLWLQKGKRLTAVRAIEKLYPRGGVCAVIDFPFSDNFEGLMFSFYTSQSTTYRSGRNGEKDDIDFNFLGKRTSLRAKFRQPDGMSSPLFIPNDKPRTPVTLCLVNTGSEVRWYVEGKLAKAEPASVPSQWVWFILRESGSDPCCGKQWPRETAWSLEIKALTTFTLKKPIKAVPINVICAPSRKCADSMSKVGVAANKNSGVSVQMYRGSQTFNACKDKPVPPGGYREFCLPKLRPGDKLAAYDKNGTPIPLNWAAQKPQGNYYKFQLRPLPLTPKPELQTNAIPPSSLPDDLRGTGVIQSLALGNRVWVEDQGCRGLVQAGNGKGDDGGEGDAEGGSEGVYHGVVLSFYTSESTTPDVKQNGDGIEFEFLGSRNRLWVSSFLQNRIRASILPPGKSSVLSNEATKVNLCIANNRHRDPSGGTLAAKLAKSVPAKLSHPQWAWFTFCLRKLRGDDKLAAYDKNGNPIVLDWKAQTPKGNS
ncbi:hypothetical protein HDU96_004284 [Phlyctochytrium bullatum]|nr:hypothetical protein HDU96_004284 [Phlyctochytrium bullatum]